MIKVKNVIWEEIRPHRIQVLNTYVRRAVRWRRNSSPYISGDLFADKADISIYPPTLRGRQPSIHEIREARVIFCPSNKLQEFFMEYEKDINAKVIIAGNSDYEFHKIPDAIPRSVKQIFLQNSFISDNLRIRTLPIGIENLRRGVNGHPSLIKSKKDLNNRFNKVLIGPLGLTHPIRNEVRDKFENSNEVVEFISQRLKPKDYDIKVNSFRFVGAVRGNGVDTHRHWESLYRGAIPIITSDSWSQSLKILQLPIVEIHSWEIEILQQVIEENRIEFFNPKNLPALWWPYWKNLINEFI